MEAYKLLEQGTLALAEVEASGIKIDVDYLERTIRKVDRKIKKLYEALTSDDVYERWKKRFGEKTSLGSRHQLRTVLEGMGHKFNEKTAKDNFKTDDGALRKLNIPFVSSWLEWDRLKNKVRTTYLGGIQREVVDGYLHPGFSLNTVTTFRSSSSEPNFQNLPIRNPEHGKIIRSCFIPKDGQALVEIDFGGIEVRISACYHRDPTMLEYICDPTKDMHRDMAAECYLLPTNQVSKQTRYCGKNMFVFPQFYGSVYFQCAPALWEATTKLKLETNDGKPLREHLREQGIRKLGKCNPKEDSVEGTFEHHIKEVERNFWQERFPVYASWKDKWYRRYRERGYFDMKTGFRCSGLMRRNDVINYPVQGAAFHCLLWCLIKLQKEIRKKKMGTKIVGQIHDSVLFDSPKEEVGTILDMATETMTKKLPAAWKWIIVPLEVEADVSFENWHAKVPWIKKDGKWGPKE